MKLHLHRAKVDEVLFQAFTRDKAGKTLSKRVSFQSDGKQTVFKRSDWTYVKPVSMDFGSHNEDIQEIRSEIQSKGVAIAEITYFPHVIFVFDLQFDSMNARVYSLDEDLARFKEKHKDMALSPMGEFLGYDELKYVDKIENRFYFDLEEMGINLHLLLDQGFDVSKVSDVDEMEHRRRFIQRRLREDIPEKVEHLGLHVSDISIHSIEPAKQKETEPTVQPAQPQAITIENKPVINVNSPAEPVQKQRPKFGATLIVLIGLVGSVFTILAYFEFDLLAVQAAWDEISERVGWVGEP